MGAGSSKRPLWYPGEPTGDVSDAGVCWCSESGRPGCSRNDKNKRTPVLVTGTGSVEKGEREIESLPVVELTNWEFIANGAFCSVYACKYRGWNVVAKRVREDLPLSERRVALVNMWNEFECLRPVSHRNVIDAYGMCRLKRPTHCNAWDEKDVCLLLEQLALGTVGHLFGTTCTMEKNLANAMARSRKMKMVPFRCRLDRVLELALALEYVHGGSGLGMMMHRDIKSVNVGFAKNGSLKLFDFGLSKIVAPLGAAETDTYKMTGEVGSYRYMAPELVRHQPYNAKADIYSWAVLSWEILAVNRPYSTVDERTFLKDVVIGGERPKLNKSWPNRLRAALASAWHTDLNKRPTAAEVVAALKLVKAELSASGKRRAPLTLSASGGVSGAVKQRFQSHQPSCSAPTSLNRTRPPSRPSNGSSSGGGVGAEGPGSPPTPASTTKRFSFSRVTISPTRSRPFLVGKPPPPPSASPPSAAEASSRNGSANGKGKEQQTPSLPCPNPAGSADSDSSSSSSSSTSRAAIDSRGGGGGGGVPGDGGRGSKLCGAAAERGKECSCRMHPQALSLKAMIADALAREVEGIRREAKAVSPAPAGGTAPAGEEPATGSARPVEQVQEPEQQHQTYGDERGDVAARGGRCSSSERKTELKVQEPGERHDAVDDRLGERGEGEPQDLAASAAEAKAEGARGAELDGTGKSTSLRTRWPSNSTSTNTSAATQAEELPLTSAPTEADLGQPDQDRPDRDQPHQGKPPAPWIWRGGRDAAENDPTLGIALAIDAGGRGDALAVAGKEAFEIPAPSSASGMREMGDLERPAVVPEPRT